MQDPHFTGTFGVRRVDRRENRPSATCAFRLVTIFTRALGARGTRQRTRARGISARTAAMSSAAMAATAAAVPAAAKVASRARGARILVGTRARRADRPSSPARGGAVLGSREARWPRPPATTPRPPPSGTTRPPKLLTALPDDAHDAASFPAEIQALVAGGADAALAPRGRAPGARHGGRGRGPTRTTTRPRRASAAAAAEAEDEAVQIVRCLKSSGSLRGFGAARAGSRATTPLRAQAQRHRGGEAPGADGEHHRRAAGLGVAGAPRARVRVGLRRAPRRAAGRRRARRGGRRAGDDQIAFGGGVEALALDTAAQKRRRRTSAACACTRRRTSWWRT